MASAGLAVGIAAATAAAAANATAVALQAGEARETPKEEGAHISLLRDLSHRPGWVAGTALSVVAWALQLLALAYAPLTVVQPTLASSQLMLLPLGARRLGERVGLREVAGAAAIVGGIATTVWAAPHAISGAAITPAIAVPLAVVGALAVACHALGRARGNAALLMIVAAGLALAWGDFGGKLLSRSASAGDIGIAAGWLAGVVLFAAMGFLSEMTALQRLPSVQVAPVIAALKIPVPVLMAFWAGLEPLDRTPLHGAVVLLGLAVVIAGAVILTRTRAVTALMHPERSEGPKPAAEPPGRRAARRAPTAGSARIGS